MVFDYYYRLSRKNQAVYDRSDAITAVRLPDAEPLKNRVADLRQALVAEDKKGAQTSCQSLATGMSERFKVSATRIKVLAARPHDDYGELQGLYESEAGEVTITLWMRTARRRKVVAFRTFLRTFLHEFCHHLDYECFKLADSFHTEGFYKRESSLFHQLVDTDAKD